MEANAHPIRPFTRMSPLRLGHLLVYTGASVLLWIFGYSEITMEGTVGLALAGFLYSALGWATLSTLQRITAYYLNKHLMRGMNANSAIQLAAAGAWAGYGPAPQSFSIRILSWIILAIPIVLGAVHQFGFVFTESSYPDSTTSGGLGYLLTGDSIFPKLNLSSSPSELGRAENLLGPGLIAFIKPWEEWQPGRSNVTTIYTTVPAFRTNMSFNDNLARENGWNYSCTGSSAWKSATAAPLVYIYQDVETGVWSGNCTVTGCSGHFINPDGDDNTIIPYYPPSLEATFSIDGQLTYYNVSSIWEYVCQQMYNNQPQQIGPGLATYSRTFTFLDVGDNARMELAEALQNGLERSYLAEQSLYQIGVGTTPQTIQTHEDAKTTWVVVVVARVQFATWLKSLTIVWIGLMGAAEILTGLLAYFGGILDIGLPAMIGISGLEDIPGGRAGQPQPGIKMKVIYDGDGHLRFAV